MEIGIYLTNIAMWKQLPDILKQLTGTITCGDYGCVYALPALDEVLDFHATLVNRNKNLHYISPKLSQAHLDEEFQRVLSLLAAGVSVSLNDWGLLYKLQPYLRTEDQIYLGRLLSKTIADWAWGTLLLGAERQRTRKYLVQNNFNHKVKIDYFKQIGVKGIEVSVNPDSEFSYARIHERGLAVLGYADNTILAVSRSCPVLKMENTADCTPKCKMICNEVYQLVPISEEKQRVYPKMQLFRNIVYWPREVKPGWDAYQRILFTWNPANSAKLVKIISAEKQHVS